MDITSANMDTLLQEKGFATSKQRIEELKQSARHIVDILTDIGTVYNRTTDKKSQETMKYMIDKLVDMLKPIEEEIIKSDAPRWSYATPACTCLTDGKPENCVIHSKLPYTREEYKTLSV